MLGQAGPDVLNLANSLTGVARDVLGMPLFGYTNFDQKCSTLNDFSAFIRSVLISAGNYRPVGGCVWMCMCVFACI